MKVLSHAWNNSFTHGEYVNFYYNLIYLFSWTVHIDTRNFGMVIAYELVMKTMAS